MPALALALALALAGGARPAPTAIERSRAAAAAPAARSAPDDRIVRLRFSWPAPLRAKVTYRKIRVGPSGRTAFSARWEERVSTDQGGLRIEARGTSWRGDLPFPHALAKDAIRASEAVVQRITLGGRFGGLEGVDAMRPVLSRVFEEAKVPPDAAERAIGLALGAMRAEAEEAWNLAVGFWAGADLALGQAYALVSEADLPLLPGVRAEQAVEFAVRRRVPCATGERVLRCVEATLRATPDRAAVERAADSLLARLLPPGEEPGDGAAKELAAEGELVLVTDPETLLPRRVAWTKAVRLGAAEKGPPRAERLEQSEWEYRWVPEPPRQARAGRLDPSER
ncbi:MAG TPA: hypothetical protein VFK90_05795 [Anaeromyxobacter sp.]|nr:hypothetical protein [Anaeromyxobacter sp.]